MNPWITQAQTLVEEGDGPLFFYDLDALRTHLQRLSRSEIGFYYACKANPLSSLIHEMQRVGWGVDVASCGELRHCLALGVDPQRLLMTGPARSLKHWQGALQSGVDLFVVESPGQLAIVHRAAAALGLRPKVLLRLQLAWDDEGENVLGGGGFSALGSDSEVWEALDLNSLPSIQMCGVHLFQWGQILEEERLCRIWQRAATEAQALARRMGFPLEVLDLGGGLGIPYGGGRAPLNWSTLDTYLWSLQRRLGGGRILLELGRYAVGPFGYYAARILDRKRIWDSEVVILEGGINHFLRPQLTGEPFPCLNEDSEEGIPMKVHGPLCTALDAVGEYTLPRNIAVGDVLVFGAAGAYGFTESMPYFLAHPIPGEAVLEGGQHTWVRQSAPASSWLV